jgi:hypothetical protein
VKQYQRGTRAHLIKTCDTCRVRGLKCSGVSTQSTDCHSCTARGDNCTWVLRNGSLRARPDTRARGRNKPRGREASFLSDRDFDCELEPHGKEPIGDFGKERRRLLPALMEISPLAGSAAEDREAYVSPYRPATLDAPGRSRIDSLLGRTLYGTRSGDHPCPISLGLSPEQDQPDAPLTLVYSTDIGNQPLYVSRPPQSADETVPPGIFLPGLPIPMVDDQFLPHGNDHFPLSDDNFSAVPALFGADEHDQHNLEALPSSQYDWSTTEMQYRAFQGETINDFHFQGLQPSFNPAAQTEQAGRNTTDHELWYLSPDNSGTQDWGDRGYPVGFLNDPSQAVNDIGGWNT